jgi:hypothetical protein
MNTKVKNAIQYTWKLIFVFALALTTTAVKAQEPGGFGERTHGGGTQVVDANGNILPADLFYLGSQVGFFEMSNHLYLEMKSLEKIFEKLSLFPDRPTDSPWRNFFRDFVFDSQTRIVVTEELPKECTFIPNEKLSSHLISRNDVGCTSRGSATYLLGTQLPSTVNGKIAFRLAANQKVLPSLILHERLIAYNPNLDYEVITGIVAAIHILRDKVFDINGDSVGTFQLTEEEIVKVNRLSFYVSSVASKKLEPFWITPEGLFINKKTKLNHP